MSRLAPAIAGGTNVCAFLDMIAESELGAELLAASDDGYNVIVGSTAAHPVLFDDYADHPRQLVYFPRLGIKSTAAGRYQLLSRYWDTYRIHLSMIGFTPENQDRVAIQQLRETRAYPLVVAGRFGEAVAKCRNIWASLPGAGYGQHENKLPTLQLAYIKAGGVVT